MVFVTEKKKNRAFRIRYLIFPGGGGHLYSKVDIMLEYKNMEKGSFFTERQVPRGPCLGCQKQQKSRKRVCFLRLNKKYVLRVYFLLTVQYVIRVMLVGSPTFPT